MHSSLADGMLDGELIECAVHMAAFHVPTGAVKAPPCQVALRTYKVVLQDNDIFADLDRDAAGEPA
jgi:ethylbenzene dioxygenase ferredoxin subunit